MAALVQGDSGHPTQLDKYTRLSNCAPKLKHLAHQGVLHCPLIDIHIGTWFLYTRAVHKRQTCLKTMSYEYHQLAGRLDGTDTK